ncbi:MAG: CopG family transcriptional regulator [Fibrobacterota bacterium]
MNRTTVMLPENLKKEIMKYASKNGMSLGEFIRTSCERYLAEHGAKSRGDSIFSARYIIRQKGPSDVSENIDKYIYGINK